MASESIRTAIQKLNGENYSIWSYKIKLLLMKDKLWEVVNKEPATPVDSTWTSKDETAQATIGLLVEDSQLRLIKNAKSAREQWKTLQEYHQKSTLSGRMHLQRRLYHTMLQESGDMVEHIATLSEYVDKLSGMGHEVDDNTHIGILLCSLPESYGTLVMALEGRPEKDLTLDFVKGKVIDEFMRRKDSREAKISASDETAMKTTYKDKNVAQSSNIQCYFCKRKGHLKSECLKYKTWLKKKQEKANKVTEELQTKEENYGTYLARYEVCLGAKADAENWIVDSGATSHMVQNRSFFEQLDAGNRGYVRLADDENRVKVQGVGTAAIKCAAASGKGSIIKAHNALYVPELGTNLLSISKLTKDGYKAIFEEDVCKIIKNGTVLATAKKVYNLYELRPERFFAGKVVAIKNRCAQDCHHVWHRRFGHRFTTAIKELAKKGLATGIQISDCGRDIVCEDCIKGKLARKPFPKESKTETHAALDLVHTDVCGPMQTTTPGGSRYFMTIIDDYSRYTHLYIMRHKDEASGFIKQFVKMVETQFEKVPKIIRSDRGREYVNKELQSFLKNQGIRIQYTAPYSPQQYGVAERKNRSLLDMSRCMLFDADLDKKYWGEAVHTANYLQNRLPSRATMRTPYELWHSEKPDLTNLQIFGGPAYMHIPKEQRKKLDVKAEKFIFVGYSDESKAYRLLDTDTNKIKISRDIEFIDKRGIKEKTPCQEECDILLHNGQNIKDNTDDDASTVSSKEDYASLNESSSSESEEDSIQNENIPEAAEQTVNRRSERSNRGVPPDRYMATLHLAIDEPEPRSLKEALSRPDKDNWKKAMDMEIQSHIKNGTWEIVPRQDGRDVIKCKWVYKMKLNGEVDRYKARLVACGYSQIYGEDYDEVFAPVAKQTTFRMLLTVAGYKGLQIKHFDVKTAFLNGELKETIYMKQPDGYNTQGGQDMVCRLRKGIYGLKQAAKIWNDCLNDCLTTFGFKQSNADLCLYIKDNNGDKIYLVVYVDDFLIAAKDTKKIDKVAEFLSTKFQLKDLGNLSF